MCWFTFPFLFQASGRQHLARKSYTDVKFQYFSITGLRFIDNFRTNSYPKRHNQGILISNIFAGFIENQSKVGISHFLARFGPRRRFPFGLKLRPPFANSRTWNQSDLILVSIDRFYLHSNRYRANFSYGIIGEQVQLGNRYRRLGDFCIVLSLDVKYYIEIRGSPKASHRIRQLNYEQSGGCIDQFSNRENVRQQPYGSDSVRGLSKEYQDASIVINNLSATQNGGQALILNSGLVAMLCAAVAFSQGTVTAGDLVLIQGLLLQLWSPLQFLGFFYRELRNALIDMGGVFDLLRRPPVQDGELNLPYHASGIDVEIRDVRFQYENQKREVLKGLSLRIKSGERVAIVGPSGSGKSTILKLLVRLHEPTAGNVYLEGVELTSLKQSSFKQAIAVVPQDTVLFNDSIQENIRYGRPQASDAEVIQAAKMARLHDSIQLMPRKYDTIVGERGLKLSGGEKQRVAIARAFLRQPRLLICDEATSALDSATEFKIMQQLNELAQGRTSIFVAHRLSTIQNCDRILVMSDGQIVEEGTHAQLIAKDQIYSDMWNMQTNEDAGPEREQNTYNEPQFALVE
eukprot:TRINITY_DN2370_c1_g1_i2.p1 TRINITY_DN2370_c1_g1~~TRINITY_DN2370_c1_g1_i2.p1  ORF type:complete len:574 (+),score=36.62 TRINITY_DN2370_c1_g1_i2:369-2090(+)